MSKRVRTSFNVEEDLLVEFKVKCTREKKSMSDVINQLISGWSGTEQVTIPQPSVEPVNKPVPQKKQEVEQVQWYAPWED